MLFIRNLRNVGNVVIMVMSKCPAKYCTAVWCRNFQGCRLDKPMSFFTFPKDRSRADQWAKFCLRDDLMGSWEAVKYRRLCSVHFKEDQYRRRIPTPRLISTALPTINEDTLGEAARCLRDASVAVKAVGYAATASDMTPSTPTSCDASYCLSDASESVEDVGYAATANDTTPSTPSSYVGSCTESSEMKYCRLCAVLCKDAVSIFEQEGVALDLANKIIKILPIAVSKTSKLPLVVCWDCINQLDTAVKFVNKCVHAQLKIEIIFKSIVEINLNCQPLIYDKSNFQVEGSKEISSPVSLQLLSREVTLKDESLHSKIKKINDNTTKDTSAAAKINENRRNRQLSSFSQLKKDEDENISSRTLQEIYVVEQSDSENEDNEEVSHQGDIHLMKKYSCKECKVHYNTQQEFRLHQRQYHMSRYPCRFCSHTLNLRKHLDRHESYHIFGKKHKCRRCPLSYDTINELNKHRMSVHLDSPRYRCKICNKTYFQEHFYLQHVRLHSVAKRFLCEMCGKAFKASSSLSAHRRMYCEKPLEKKLHCEFCKLMFHQKSHLKIHVRTHTGEKPYLCSICGKGYRDGHLLKHHLDTHSVSKHACSFCGQLFLRNHGLVSHLKRHANCNVCLQKFDKKFKQHLLHRREFHSEEMKEELEKGFGGEKLIEFADGGGKIGDFSKTVVKCENCTRNFVSKFWLQSHQKGLCIDQPIFKCPICEKITRRKDSYEIHMMLHSENRTHQCSHCSQTFDIYQNLVKHEKEHKVTKPFSCSECGKGFDSSVSLSKHLISHFKGRVYTCRYCDKYFTSQVSLLIHRCQHNTESKQLSPYSMSLQKSSQARLAQMLEMEQQQSTENTSMLSESYILNINEESYTEDVSPDNVGRKVLVYESQCNGSNKMDVISGPG